MANQLSIITLLEKKDKDKRDISNWQPISLINVDVNIGSKAIAKRLESVLPSIIHFNQCAYVKGRTIFDAVRTIDDILDYTEKSKINGRMIAIDFKKAFDSVSREFLFRTLSAFCFGPSFTQWIHTFYKNISSCVLNNGFSTAPDRNDRSDYMRASLKLKTETSLLHFSQPSIIMANLFKKSRSNAEIGCFE